MVTHDSNEPIVVNVSEFRKPAKLDLQPLERAACGILEQFDKLRNPKFVDTIKSAENKVVLRNMDEKGHVYQKYLESCARYIESMSSYATDYIEYIDVLSKEDVLGDDFLDAMRSLLDAAKVNKERTLGVNGEMCQLQFDLQSILSNLGEPILLDGSERVEEAKLEEDAEHLREAQSSHTIAAIGTGVSAGVAAVAAPFTGGLSLVLLSAVAAGSGASMLGTTISSIIHGEKAKDAELQLEMIKMDEVKVVISTITDFLKKILVELFPLEKFWESEIEAISCILEKHRDMADTATFRIARMKATAMTAQLSAVRAAFESFRANVRC